jgi:AraC-like DNA-binding protein
VLRYCAHVDANPAAALVAQGIDPARLSPGGRIPASAFGRLLDRLVEISGDACFGLHLGAWCERFPPSHLVVATVLNSRNVGDALERLLRFHAILSDAVAPVVVRRPGVVTVRIAAPFHGRLGRQETDAAIATIVTLLRRCSAAARPTEVRLREVPATALPEYERVLGVRIRGGADADELSFAADALEAPVELADRELLGMLERLAARRLRDVEDTSWSGKVDRAARAALLESSALPRLPELARALAVSARTLQYSLRAEGLTYRQVTDRARRALAEDHLRDPGLTLSEIAFVSGFADQSAFTHAFRRWTGQTPQAYRQAIRERGASVRYAGSAPAAGRGARARRAHPLR